MQANADAVILAPAANSTTSNRPVTVGPPLASLSEQPVHDFGPISKDCLHIFFHLE